MMSSWLRFHLFVVLLAFWMKDLKRVSSQLTGSSENSQGKFHNKGEVALATPHPPSYQAGVKEYVSKIPARDQVGSSSGRQSRRRAYHTQQNAQPRSYSYSYDSGPQYYESTSKPIRYYREYHSPPSSYRHSYNTGPQGSSYRSPPQRHSHRNSYNDGDSGEYHDGDSYSSEGHVSYDDPHHGDDFEDDSGYDGEYEHDFIPY